MGFTFLQPNENVVLGGAVATSAGATDATYTDEWLVDGRGRPVRSTTGTVTWAITALASGEIGLVVVHSHTIDPALGITIGGGVSGAGTGPPARADRIHTNPGIVIATPASTASLTIAISGNSKAVVIGELLAGKRRSITRSLPSVGNGTEFGYLKEIGRIPAENRFGSVPAKDLGIAARWLRTQVVVSKAEADVLIAWWESTRNDTRMSAIVPFDDFNDVWCVKFVDFAIGLYQNLWIATMLFEEWPRRRWID